MERWDQVELAALLATLRATEPRTPTVCEGWEARHMAAHLYLRKHRPWRAYTQGEASELAELAEEAADPARYATLIDEFAAPAARLTPMALAEGPLGNLTNHLEYVIHHEDVRRGAGPVEPYARSADQNDAIFGALGAFSRMGLKQVPVGVVLVVPGGRRKVVRKAPDSVAVIGAPVELALVVSGRRRAADVEVVGADDAVEAFEAFQAAAG